MLRKIIRNWIDFCDFESLKAKIDDRELCIYGEEEQACYVSEVFIEYGIEVPNIISEYDELKRRKLKDDYFTIVLSTKKTEVEKVVLLLEDKGCVDNIDYCCIEEMGKEYTYFSSQKKRFRDTNGNEVIVRDPEGLVNCRIVFRGFNNRIELGKSVSIVDTTIMCFYGSSIIINDQCNISECDIKTDNNRSLIVFGKKCKFGEGCEFISKSELTIGDKTTIHKSGVVFADYESPVNIGVDCMISWPVYIRSNNGHALLDLKERKNTSLMKEKYVKIGNHVWIGQGVNVISNADIKDNCVIGAGGLVNSLIPENSLAVGLPARVIKRNMSWDRDMYYEFHDNL